MDPGFRLRELFHILVLRELSIRLARRPYAVKGGICLRFFHRSPRLSEDLDLDVTPHLPTRTLETNVDAILTGVALTAGLRRHGVESLVVTKPKQTETTQRWKVGLRLAGGTVLATRVEFSRRAMPSDPQSGAPGPEFLREAFLAPFAVLHYGAEAMTRQKVSALASPSRTAARDLFDLHHLFVHAELRLEAGIDAKIVRQAIEKADAFAYSDFREQVLPYLPNDLRPNYESASAFENVRRQVETRLLEMLG